MIKLGKFIFRSKKSLKKSSQYQEFKDNIDFFDRNFKIFLEVFLFDCVTIVFNLSYVTMCLPPMHLRMIL